MVLKYAPLARYFAAQVGDRVVLSLGEIETILGVPLPKGASTSGWWAKGRGDTHGRAWLDAGWSVASVTVRATVPLVTFVRRLPGTRASRWDRSRPRS